MSHPVWNYRPHNYSINKTLWKTIQAPKIIVFSSNTTFLLRVCIWSSLGSVPNGSVSSACNESALCKWCDPLMMLTELNVVQPSCY